MNALSVGGYESAIAQLETHRDAEARILARLNGRLIRAVSRMASDYPGFLAALHDNDRFWKQIAIDLADEGNRLPEQLRASLISIACFVIRHSAKVRSGEGSAQPLVEINMSILRGLNQGKESA